MGVAHLENDLVKAHNQGEDALCERIFTELCQLDKVTEKIRGLYMIGVPRMFTRMGRVDRAQKFVRAVAGPHTATLFSAICNCVRRVFKLNIPLASVDMKHQDDWALYCALSLKYWLGSVQVSDMSTFFGKVNLRPLEAQEAFVKRRDKWLMTVPVHEYDGSENTFYETFRLEVNRMFLGMTLPKETLSFEDFYSDFGTWARSGAVQRQEFNPVHGVKKTKWSFAFFASPEEVLNFLMLYHNKTVVYNKFIKPEQAGARWALTGALPGHILMSYISWHLDDKLKAFPEMFIFQNTDKQSEFWAKRSTQARAGKWFITGDYSGWDEGVTFGMTGIVVDEVLNWTAKWNPQFVKDWGVDIRNSFNNFSVDGIKCKNGLPTGSRWTMMLNSICNRVLQMMAARKSGCYDFAVVGDDFDVMSEDDDKAEIHLQVLKEMGFTTARHKTGVHRSNGEFLKNYYGKEYLCMSPYRAIRSILYANDVESERTDAERRMARADLWARFLGRLRQWEKVSTFWNDTDVVGALNIMVEDMLIAFRSINESLVSRWLRTPSIVGGAGLLEDTGGSWVAMKAMMSKENVRSTIDVRVMQRKHSMQAIMNQYLTQRILESYISKQLPSSFTMAVDLGQPKWSLHAVSSIASVVPTPNLQLPSSIKPKLPSDTAPVPDRRGLYTAKVFAAATYSYNDLAQSFRSGDYWVDSRRRSYLKVGLIDVGYFRWVHSLHGVSAAVKLELVKTGGSFPLARELVSWYGDTLAGVIWEVSKVAVQKLYTKPGSSSEGLLAGVLHILRYYATTNSARVRYRLTYVGVGR